MLALKNVGARNLYIRHRSDIANVWNLAQSVALNLEYASLDEQNYRTTIDAAYPYRLHRYTVHRDQPPPRVQVTTTKNGRRAHGTRVYARGGLKEWTARGSGLAL